MEEIILVPLDGSKAGETALPYVERLLSKLSPEVKVKITLLQVLSRMVHPVVAGGAVAEVPYTEAELEIIKNKATEYLDKIGEALRSKGATVTARVVIGSPPEEIVRAAEEINADTIAMSTHGRSGLSRWAFGSVTDKVLRHGGKIPILTVKALPEAEEA